MSEIPWLEELKRQALEYYDGPPVEGQEREHFPVEVSSKRLLVLCAIAEMAEQLYYDGSNMLDRDTMIDLAKAIP